MLVVNSFFIIRLACMVLKIIVLFIIDTLKFVLIIRFVYPSLTFDVIRWQEDKVSTDVLQ